MANLQKEKEKLEKMIASGKKLTSTEIVRQSQIVDKLLNILNNKKY